MIQGKISDGHAVCEICYKNKICTMTKYNNSGRFLCSECIDCINHEKAVNRVMGMGIAFGLAVGTVITNKLIAYMI